jgi:hypothetical protein
LARDQDGTTSYWSADGRTWQEAQGVAPTPVYAVGPAGILSGFGLSFDVTLSVDGTVWSELLPTMGLWDDYLIVAGRGDQYLAWPYQYPPSRIHSSVDGLTWTTSDIAVGMLPYDWDVRIHEVRWNGAQYVLNGTQLVGPGRTPMIARSCNGRVWHYTTICTSDITMDPEFPSQPDCAIDFATTAAMTVVVYNDSTFDFNQFEWDVHPRISYSADLVTWASAGTWEHPLFTVVVGDP